MDFFALTRFALQKLFRRTGLVISRVVRGYRHCLDSS